MKRNASHKMIYDADEESGFDEIPEEVFEGETSQAPGFLAGLQHRESIQAEKTNLDRYNTTIKRCRSCGHKTSCSPPPPA